MEQQQENSLFDLQLDSISQSYLMETSRWGKFLAIIGFIGCGLLIVLAIFMATAFSTLSSQLGAGAGVGGGVLAGIYVVLALLYFFPCYYLLNFSVKMQTALRNNDQLSLQAALANQKSCYKFVGILTIVIMSLYILGIIFAGIFATSLGS